MNETRRQQIWRVNFICTFVLNIYDIVQLTIADPKTYKLFTQWRSMKELLVDLSPNSQEEVDSNVWTSM